MGEFTIELKELRFFSFHGLYEEEKIRGGEFLVDLFAKFPSGQSRILTIDETTDYSAVYEIIKAEMNEPRELLETLTQSIAEKVHARYPSLKVIEIRVEKKNPPISGFTGTVAVRFRKEYYS